MVPRILILDGGLGSSLTRKYNVKLNGDTPLWTTHMLLSDRETLLRCQRDFGNVPVDIILTATYQVSAHAFAQTKTETFIDGVPATHISEILSDAVTVAKEAIKGDAKVALSIGPYGAVMIPSQEYSGYYDSAHDSAATLEIWHTERMKLFANITNVQSRLGYLSFETIPRIDEIRAMRRALDSTPELAGIPFWMTCVYPDDMMTLPTGATPEQALNAMLNSQFATAVPWAVGINCTNVCKLDALLRKYEAAITEMIEQDQLQKWPALVLYPDGVNGEKYNSDTARWELPEAEIIDVKVPWAEQVAQVVWATETRGHWEQIIVGGCCLSTSEDIDRLRNLLILE